NAEGGFDWSDEAHVRFLLRAPGDENPFAVPLKFLAHAEVLSLAPFGSKNKTDNWQVPTEVLSEDGPFPFPDPPSPATLPAIVRGRHPGNNALIACLVIDHWADA